MIMVIWQFTMCVSAHHPHHHLGWWRFCACACPAKRPRHHHTAEMKCAMHDDDVKLPPAVLRFMPPDGQKEWAAVLRFMPPELILMARKSGKQ